jgi:hypothetical protein
MSLLNLLLSPVSTTAADAVRRRKFFLLLSRNGINREEFCADIFESLRSFQTEALNESESRRGLEIESKEKIETNSRRPLAAV